MNDLHEQSPVKVGVVLLNWNGGEYTNPCIDSLLAGEVKPWRILVWDNASNDGSPDQISAQFPSVQLVRSEVNQGFALANNLAAEMLLRDGVDFIWILNNDTMVAPTCLGVLLDTMAKHPEAAAATGKILYDDPHDLIWYAGGGCSSWSLNAFHLGVGMKDVGQYDRPKTVQFISGCCMLIRRNALETYGLFDQRFFIYCEDTDWCLRIQARGGVLRYAPAATLWHRVSATMKKNTLGPSGGRVSPRQHYLTTRNQLFVIRRHARRPWQFMAALAYLLVQRLFISGGLLIFRRWEKLRALWRGITDGLRTSICGQEILK